MIVKEHERDNRKIVVLCETALLGKTYEDEKSQLDLTSAFFQGVEITDLDEITKKMDGAHIIYAVGTEPVTFLKKLKIVQENEIKETSTIPHVQVFFV